MQPPSTEEQEQEELELALLLSCISAQEQAATPAAGTATEHCTPPEVSSLGARTLDLIGPEGLCALEKQQLRALALRDDGSSGAGPSGSQRPAMAQQGTTGAPGPRELDLRRGQLSLCSVCMDATADGACVPCGHVCACMKCLGALRKTHKKCPICNAQVREVLQIFLS